ncbi:peptidylprolyl isomerase [Wielerella bovis]|uniref:peptidylprolyl isomerase n=1 Tax=Wielerella bovis TaxID=2917790 RepID=UPI002018D14E|nr:SurA N-terminal domain-containing protein [Wielerella bovis]MCG7657174.1 SurA N-terminal domain-containing protein [Wielerella bovis]MCG7659397.1 SurA N-terminal domain-containing protein [Wielerella bovis]
MFHALEKHRTPAQILLGLIGLSFMSFGLISFQSRPNDAYIVQIGEQVITRMQLEQAIRNTEASGGQADRQAVFQTLMQQAYLLEGAKKLGISVSDEQIKQFIVDMPDFHTNGQFDANKFQQFLEHNYANEQAFMDEWRVRLTTMAMQRLLVSNVSSDSQATQILNATLSPRTVRSAAIDPQAFVAQVKISDEELKKFYEANQKNYALQQGIKYEYMVLSPKDLAAKQIVSNEEIQQAFNEMQGSLKAKRTIAHILINAPKSADADTRAKAKAEAEKILAEVKAKPEQFAELAKKYSQDVGSANNGGMLGEFAQDGRLGSQSLEDAAFALKEGEISDVVESDAGYHIARVTDINTPDFEGQKEEIRQRLQERKAQAEYAKLVEQASELAFETPDKLQPAAEKSGVELQKQEEWLTRANASSLNVPQQVVDALFGNEVFTKKHNSEAISVNGVTWFVRATETRNESIEPFEQVKARVQEDFVRSESIRLARTHAETMLKDLQAGKAVSLTWSAPEEVLPLEFRQHAPQAAYEALMKAMPRDGKSAYTLVDMPNMPVLTEVSAIKTVADDKQQLAMAHESLSALKGDALAQAYIAILQKEIPTKQGAEKVSDSE